MDMVIFAFLVSALTFTSVCFIYVRHQLREARKHLREASKICEDAVTSLRSGKG